MQIEIKIDHSCKEAKVIVVTDKTTGQVYYIDPWHRLKPDPFWPFKIPFNRLFTLYNYMKHLHF